MTQEPTEHIVRREDIPFVYSEPSAGKSEGVIADFDELGRLRSMYSVREGVMNGPYLSVDYDSGEASTSLTTMFPDPVRRTASGETLYQFVQEQVREIGRKSGRLVELKCGFCRRGQAEGASLIAGIDSLICHECIENCAEIVAFQNEQNASGATESVPGPFEAEPSRMSLLLTDLDELLGDLGIQFEDCWNPPANDTDLNDLAECIGSDLPSDFVEFYRNRNGSPNGAFVIFPDIYRLLSSSEIIEEWKDFYAWADEEDTVETIGPVKPLWWNLHWLPVGIDDGNPLCLDLDPPDEGRYGQVIKAWHDWDRRSVQAGSFSDWLEEFIEELRQGKYVVSETGRALVNRDE